ncbi:MAG: hypothetical protein J6A47_06245 [Bacilli bacterium]|nr:hypothetical protein [Bacilli bacterium]
MKKRGLILTLSLCLSFLIGCGQASNDRLPETQFEKVQYALNGVEKSLKNQKGANRYATQIAPKGKRSEADALSAIYGVFTDGASGEPDFKYDEPPMIQFLYIKKTLEKIGSGFDFGVKYQQTITGNIYYDFSTGKETAEPAYKQDYSLNFSLYISIDENDLINCKTLFDVNYTHGSDIHHQAMYAEMLLNYDMKKTDANYKLKLFALDDCCDFNVDEEKYFSAEFDYVNVSSDAITEWGKIGYSANKAVVIDAGHPSFTDYLSDVGFQCKPTIQLYKNGKRYQRNQLGDDKASQAIGIACDDLGVNGTEIQYKDYIKKPATPQPILKTCFDEFSGIYGRDLMYNIVYTGAKEHPQEGGDQERVDASWPTQGLIEDGYQGVPGFLSKTATFSVSRDYSDESNSYFYVITVLNQQSDDFERYRRTLSENGFTEIKEGDHSLYLHPTANGEPDYGIAIIRMGGTDMIVISKTDKQSEGKDPILIANGNDYTGEYSSYKEQTYQSASAIAAVVEHVSGGQISADALVPYIISGSSRSYEIQLDKGEFSSDDFSRSYKEYVGSYSGWAVISENSAFYATVNNVDVLILIDKSGSNQTITIHSFTFMKGSISEILSGGQGGGSSSSQPSQRVTVYLYEVDAQTGIPELVDSYEFDDGEIINVIGTFGEGEYFEDPGCAISIHGEIVARDGLSIYRRVNSQVQTQGSIVVIDANTKQELFTYTDVIGASVKGGAIFNYVLYRDSTCSTMVGLEEEITLGAEQITLYCRDNSIIDYVTLTVNTYINGILSPYRSVDFGVRRGEIMNNYSSYSFPSYYDGSSYFDAEFTMTLNGKELGRYSQDLVALVDNSVLNIYCENDWCKVYHINNGQGGAQFDIVWEDGGLYEGAVILHGSRYYHIAQVGENTATYDESYAAYTYSLCSVYNGKVITTQKDYFGSEGYSFYINPDSEPIFFLDKDLTTPLTPAEGASEAVFKTSFTLYTRFSR